MLGLDADVNSDWKAEQLRVDERVKKEAAGDSPEARQFWSNKSRGSVLARMLDRTWRAAVLLEGCRKTLADQQGVLSTQRAAEWTDCTSGEVQ